MTETQPAVILSHDARPISVLNVSRSLKSSLTEAGYRTLGDIGKLSAGDLSAELSISEAEATDLLFQIHPPQAGPSRQDVDSTSPQPPQSQIVAATAAALLSTDHSPRFSTQSTSIDALLSQFVPSQRHSTPTGHNGSRKGKEKEDRASIMPGMTIEVSGPPGGGKTCVALGIVLGARMAKRDIEAVDPEGQPLAGEVLVIDTEGGITAERVLAAAESLTRTIATSARDIVRGIHFVRIHTQVQMIGFLHTLDEWLEAHPRVTLIVIDTLSYHFRQPGLDMSSRRRVMELVKQRIGQATTVHGCAVVVCNQLATKLLTAENKPANFDTGDRAILMPQLGDAWTTGKTIRLVLFRGGPGDELRYAHASVSGTTRDQLPWACFDIDSDGLPSDVAEAIYKSPTTLSAQENDDT